MKKKRIIAFRDSLRARQDENVGSTHPLPMERASRKVNLRDHAHCHPRIIAYVR
jgi:hypothetical protein